ncbi:heavy metal translocatin [Wallemia mellicola]|nr:heavy metal translocatin [Wallemia mellicola]TIC08507.1 heavy metal translocatin [Wallemia mellicola]TIC49937.1 heavy metal translocatin [Wallemia mellicola]
METILIPTIHCPSCVERITSVLSDELGGRISEISVNLLNKQVTFHTDSKSARRDALNTLEEIGYQVENEKDYTSTFRKLRRPKGKGKARDDDLLIQQRHLDSCQECREKEENGSKPEDIFYITKLSISGMTCSSCTQTLSSTLKALDGIDTDSVRVNLMAAEAEFVHQHTLSFDEIIDEIQTVGYDSEIISSAPINQHDDDVTVTTKFDIEGMTCSSCSQSITSALKMVKGIVSVDVSVTNARAIVEHTRDVTVEHLVDTIEEIGFEATVVSTKSKDVEKSNERSVEIEVEGMFCSHCPAHLLETLNKLPLLSYSNDISLDNPFVTITYIPNPSSLTIRSLLGDISSAHPRFSLKIVEQTASTSRATAIHLSEAKVWLLRVSVSALFSIAALIVNVIGMEILDEDHPIRRELERPIWGQATVGMIVMFAISTPMYFIVGWNFHKKSFLSLKASSLAIKKSKKFPWKALITWGSMDLLVTLGTTVAYVASIAMLIIDVRLDSPDGRMMGYFEMPIFLIFFIGIGRMLESWMKAKQLTERKTGDAIATLGKLKPQKALLVNANTFERQHEELELVKSHETKASSDVNSKGSFDFNVARLSHGDGPSEGSSGNVQEVPLSLVEIGDTLLVQPGEAVPIDGVLLGEGSFPFDMSSVTGESLPITLHEGDELLTGTTTMKAVYMKVTSTASETLIDRIIRVVSEAQSKKAPIEKIADAVTGVFVPVIVFIAIITLIVWLVVAANANELGGKTDRGGKMFFALQFAISSLVIACPCGFGLAVPTAIAVASGIAAKLGVLVQSGSESFELANKVEVVVFDKTGTLTKGELALVGERKLNNETSNTPDGILWDLVVKTEEQSSHPIAKAVKTYASLKQRSNSPELTSTEEVSGRGVRATFNYGDKELEMRIGNAKFAGVRSTEAVDEWKKQGNSIVYIATKDVRSSDDDLVTIFALAIADSPRDESAFVVEYLRSSGKNVFMLSGDEEITAKSIAKQVGIDEGNVIAGVMPDEKVKHIERLRREAANKGVSSSMYNRMKTWMRIKENKQATPLVMFIGDGLNDAGAIVASDVGCAQGSGSQVTLSSAHFILLNSSLRSLINIFRLSKLVKIRIAINFVWACIFNIVLIPIAAGVFYPVGVKLPPVYSALAMALSSVSVVISSLLLRLHKFSN